VNERSVSAPAASRSRVNLQSLTVAFLVLGVALRLFYLDADPHYYEWIGYISDEGRWIHSARDIVLFGHLVRDNLYDLHLMLAPLFQLASYVSLSLLGPSTFSARLFSALCGSALVFVFWRHLRHRVSPLSLLAGTAVLAVQVDYVALSRLAVPEMAAILFQGLAYFALVHASSSPLRLMLGGFLLLLAVATKATVAPVAGIFALMVLTMPRRDGSRWKDLFWFTLGAAGPVIVSAAAAAACCLPASTLQRWLDSPYVTVLSNFVGLSSVYRIVSFPLDNPLAPALGALLLGMWLSWLGWIATPRDQRDEASARYLVTSAVWALAYMVVMLALRYFPSRYMLHVVLPMVVNITVGIDLLQRAGMSRVLAALRGAAIGAWLRAALLTLPTAVFAAPVIGYVLAIAGVDSARLRGQVTCLALSWMLSAVAWVTLRSRDRGLQFFLLFPILAEVAWLVASLPMFPDSALWPRTDVAIAHWMFVAAVGVALAACLTLLVGRRAPLTASLLVAVYFTGYVGVAALRLAPAYTGPTYTLRDYSRALAENVPRTATIYVDDSEALFTDNRLRYTRYERVLPPPTADPEVLVTVFRSDVERQELARRFEHGWSYLPRVAQEYYETHPFSPRPDIHLYWRRE
jgi:hypothetical protein